MIPTTRHHIDPHNFYKSEIQFIFNSLHFFITKCLVHSDDINKGFNDT